jgi:hypothetical protein
MNFFCREEKKRTLERKPQLVKSRSSTNFTENYDKRKQRFSADVTYQRSDLSNEGVDSAPLSISTTNSISSENTTISSSQE